MVVDRRIFIQHGRNSSTIASVCRQISRKAQYINIYMACGLHLKYSSRRSTECDIDVEAAPQINSLYSPLNILVALVRVEIWRERDRIKVSCHCQGVSWTCPYFAARSMILDPPYLLWTRSP